MPQPPFSFESPQPLFPLKGVRTEDCIPLATSKERGNQASVLAQQHPILLNKVGARSDCRQCALVPVPGEE
jgi:hypothetical protein